MDADIVTQTGDGGVITTAIFSLPVRVYYQDTDAGGVVYHSNYLNFMERARYEWLREMGFDIHSLVEVNKAIFMIRSLSIEYFSQHCWTICCK